MWNLILLSVLVFIAVGGIIEWVADHVKFRRSPFYPMRKMIDDASKRSRKEAKIKARREALDPGHPAVNTAVQTSDEDHSDPVEKYDDGSDGRGPGYGGGGCCGM